MGKITTILLILGFLCVSAFAYHLQTRLRLCAEVNAALVQEGIDLIDAQATANAAVAIATDEKSGDVLVRVNGIHYHYFQKACLKPLI